MTAPARPTATLDAARAEARRLWMLAYQQLLNCDCVPTGALCQVCVAVDRDADVAGNRVEDLERMAATRAADDHAGRAT